jgi:hypothetical protein
MAVEPQRSVITVSVDPGSLLGVIICEVTNTVNAITEGGAIAVLNRARPGSLEVGDRIVEVDGQRGRSFELIRAWVAGLRDGSGELSLTVVRPVEFDVHIDVSQGKELGMCVLEEYGFVSEIRRNGLIDTHNALQGPHGSETLRTGDRIVQVSGREPPAEDGMPANVLPYLRLAVAGGASPLALRVRRGDKNPSIPARVAAAQQPCEPRAEHRAVLREKAPKSSWFGQKSFGFSCLPSIFTPPTAVRSKFLRKIGRGSAVAHPHSQMVNAKVADSNDVDPSTPSTKVSTKSPSTDSLPDASFVEARDQHTLVDNFLMLPGVVRRSA